MFVNSVSANANLYTRKPIVKNQTTVHQVITNHGLDQVSFSGKKPISPEILKNQLRILLTQDIFSAKLKVKMPETPLEKEVLLEILQNREKLDRLTRLSNEKLQLQTLVNKINKLKKENPSHPDLPALIKELENKGNIETVLKTLNKHIDIEKKKNKGALDYFQNIAKMEDEYLEQRLIKVSAMDKFTHQIKKNNINTDSKTSTKAIIDMITSGEAQTGTKPAKISNQPLTKKQLFAQVQEQYEQLLRENIDVYEGRMNHNDDARKARKLITESNIDMIKRFPGIEKQLSKIYEATENKYTHKIDRLTGVDIYPIGEIWKDMKVVEKSMKDAMTEINGLRNQITKSPESTELKEALRQKEKALEELRNEWLKGVKFSVKYEGINRERMSTAGRLSEYEYLTGENKTIKRHKSALEIFRNNNNKIPEDLWATLLT